MFFEDLVQFLRALGQLAYYLLVLSYNIGKILVELLKIIINFLSVTWQGLVKFFNVFYEDYLVFSNDLNFYISSIFIQLKTTGLTGVTKTYSGITYLMKEIAYTFTTGHVKISNFGNFLISSIFCIIDFFKKFSILIGNGVWFLLTLLPNFIFFLLKIVQKTIWLTVNFIVRLLQHFYEILLNIFSATINYFKDVPLQAVCGILAIYVVYKNANLFKTALRFFGRKLKLVLRRIALKIKDYLIVRCALVLEYIRRTGTRTTIIIPPQATPRQPLNSSNSSCSPSPGQSITRKRKSLRSISNKKLGDSNLCIICQDRDRCVVLFPCRHLCLCVECAREISSYQNDCPLCRTRISQKINVFV